MNETFSKEFTHLKIHTQYSICEGALRTKDLGKYCKENKIKAIGLCDSNNLCGALEFSQEISKVGTQPIIGSQINFKFSDTIGKVPIFAKTEEGFKNFSHAKTIFTQTNMDNLIDVFRPPYGKKAEKALKDQIKP